MQQPLQVIHAPCPQCNGPAVFRWVGGRWLGAFVRPTRPPGGALVRSGLLGVCFGLASRLFTLLYDSLFLQPLHQFIL